MANMTCLHHLLSAQFMPHGYCYLWIPSLVMLHVASDGIIALAYMMIPVSLAYLVYKREDIPFGWIFFCFCAFIIACGTTHLMEIWTLWHGDYWLSGFVKAITAVVSFTTAILLIKLIPTIIALPSPSKYLELQEANIQAKIAERRFRVILESSPDAIIIFNSNGKMTLVNAQTEKLFGYHKDQLIGQPVDILFTDTADPKSSTALHNFFKKFRTNSQGTSVEYLGITKNNNLFPVEISFNPLEALGEAMGLATIRDITERKKIDHLKDEFISMVNHELRSPLTSLLGSLDLLWGGVAGNIQGEAKELVDIARSNATRLLRLINDILDIEKIEAGKMAYKYDIIEVSDLLKDSIAANMGYAENYQVTLSYTKVLPNIRIHVDTDRAIQVITNLLSNATKFSPRGGQVSISTTIEDNYVKIAVSDNGPGIPPEFQAKIFEKFSQADNSISRERGGTGLGLSISKAITEKLNGRLEFTTSSSGTTFYFYLPIVK